jgi:acetyl-CoA decarbonylase/synthase complex subunit delta
VAFELPKISYSGKIKEVELGQDKKVTVGGETCYPFHLWEGEMPHRPVVAMEVWDHKPEDWPAACSEPFADVLDDPAAWAKKCQDEYGAEAIVLQLKSTDPNAADASPADAAATVKKVLGAIEVPLILWGVANANKDADVLKKIAEDNEGANLLLGPVDEDNHKQVGAAALGFKHQLIASSPIDVNLAKQLNILLGNLGVPMDSLVIDPTTGGLGYGMEYCYSVMERIRMAALVQEDDKLVLPMINNMGGEVWKAKEAKQTDDEAPELGDSMTRGMLMEATEAVALLLAGSDILILRHPETVKLVKAFLEAMLAEPAARAEKKTGRGKIEPIAAAPKPAAAAAPKPAAKPEAKEPPKPEAKPSAEAAAEKAGEKKPDLKVAEKPEPAAEPAPAASTEETEQAKAKAAADAEAKKKAEAEAKKKAEEEAKAKAAAEAKAQELAEEKARREASQKQMEEVQELRKKRREEREKRMAEMEKAAPAGKEGVEFGEPRPEGVAGPEASYILRSLERWRLRGEGVLKK